MIRPLVVLVSLCLVLGLPSVVRAAAPANDQFANAIVLTNASLVVTGSNVGATKQAGEPNHAGNAGGRSVWWIWTSPFSGSVVVRTTGSTFDTLLGIYTGTTVQALALIAVNDQDMLDPLGADTSRVKFEAQAGVQYAIAVDGYAGDAGTIVLTIEPPPRPPNDDFASRMNISGPFVRVPGGNQDATAEEGEPLHADAPPIHSVWWSWTAPATGTATFSTLGSEFDTVLAVYSGDAVDDLTWLGANDQDPIGGSTSRVTLPVRAGARYEIAVDGWNGESGEIVLTAEMAPVPPVLKPPLLLTNGLWQITVLGTGGRVQVLEARTSLSTGAWFPIATNVLPPDGTWSFIDPQADSLQKFYRAR